MAPIESTKRKVLSVTDEHIGHPGKAPHFSADDIFEWSWSGPVLLHNGSPRWKCLWNPTLAQKARKNGAPSVSGVLSERSQMQLGDLGSHLSLSYGAQSI
jgi:hypothetical protein